MSMRTTFCITALAFALSVCVAFAEPEKQECSPDEIFKACDTNKDNKISREEWDTMDSNKDDMITNDEWDKYKYKSADQKTSPFQIRYYDVYGDGTMGKEDFLRNFKRLQ